MPQTSRIRDSKLKQYKELFGRKISFHTKFITEPESDDDEKKHYLNADVAIEAKDITSSEYFFNLDIDSIPARTCFELYHEFEPKSKCNFKENTWILFCKHDKYIYWRLAFSIDWVLWREKVNVVNFLRCLEREIKQRGFDISQWETFDERFIIFSISIHKEINSKSIATEYIKICQELNLIYKNTLQSCEVENFAFKLKFPKHLSSIYYQYFSYFSQFLEDLGLESRVKIDQHSDELLLSVEPANKKVALENIFLALGAYLKLPSDSSIISLSSSSPRANYQYQKLLNLLTHLKAQALLDNAEFALDNKINKVINNFTQINLLNSVSKMDELEDSWQPIKGIKITKFKGKFFEIDIPLIVKSLKMLVSKFSK